VGGLGAGGLGAGGVLVCVALISSVPRCTAWHPATRRSDGWAAAAGRAPTESAVPARRQHALGSVHGVPCLRVRGGGEEDNTDREESEDTISGGGRLDGGADAWLDEYMPEENRKAWGWAALKVGGVRLPAAFPMLNHRYSPRMHSAHVPSFLEMYNSCGAPWQK